MVEAVPGNSLFSPTVSRPLVFISVGGAGGGTAQQLVTGLPGGAYTLSFQYFVENEGSTPGYCTLTTSLGGRTVNTLIVNGGSGIMNSLNTLSTNFESPPGINLELVLSFSCNQGLGLVVDNVALISQQLVQYNSYPPSCY